MIFVFGLKYDWNIYVWYFIPCRVDCPGLPIKRFCRKLKPWCFTKGIGIRFDFTTQQQKLSYWHLLGLKYASAAFKIKQKYPSSIAFKRTEVNHFVKLIYRPSFAVTKTDAISSSGTILILLKTLWIPLSYWTGITCRIWAWYSKGNRFIMNWNRKSTDIWMTSRII